MHARVGEALGRTDGKSEADVYMQTSECLDIRALLPLNQLPGRGGDWTVQGGRVYADVRMSGHSSSSSLEPTSGSWW